MTPILARLAGYVIAWALVLGVLMAACSAVSGGGSNPGTYSAPTLAPWPTYGPEPTYAPVPHVTDDPRATLAPEPVYNCGDADPNDPEIDPAYDCEEVTP